MSPGKIFALDEKFTYRAFPCQHLRGIPAKRRDGYAMDMTERWEKRQAWVRRIIAERCKSKADFARRIGVAGSYVTRLLKPRGHRDYKGVGDEVMERIAAAFPDVEPPPDSLYSGASREAISAEHGVMTSHMVITALLGALALNLPGAMPVFEQYLREECEAADVPPEEGLIAVALGIAKQANHRAAAHRKA